MNVRHLWQERQRRHNQQIVRYVSLAGTSLVYCFLFSGAAGAYCYAVFLRSSPSAHTAIGAVTMLLTLLLTRNRVRTYVKEADIVFLLRAESKLTSYFRRSLATSLFWHCLQIGLTCAAAIPLYMYASDGSLFFFVCVLLLLFLVKAWNILIYWTWNQHAEQHVVYMDSIVRFFLNGVFVYLLLLQAHVLFLTALLFIMLGLLLYSNKQRRAGVHWERLIRQEKDMDMAFYRFMNFFTDVPQVLRQPKPRIILSLLLQPVWKRMRSPFLYLYSLLFLRANDFFGLYTRFTAIGLLLLVYIPGFYGKYAASLLLLYASFLQLSHMRKQLQYNLLTDSYPLPKQKRAHAFTVLLSILLFIQHVTFTIVIGLTVHGIGSIVLPFVSGIAVIGITIKRQQTV